MAGPSAAAVGKGTGDIRIRRATDWASDPTCRAQCPYRFDVGGPTNFRRRPLADLLAADLTGLDLVAIMIDGVHFADHL